MAVGFWLWAANKWDNGEKNMTNLQTLLQLILQADDVKYASNCERVTSISWLKQMVDHEVELSICNGEKEVLLAMNYDRAQCRLDFQIVDWTRDEEAQIKNMTFRLDASEDGAVFTRAFNFYLLGIDYIESRDLQSYKEKISRLY